MGGMGGGQLGFPRGTPQPNPYGVVQSTKPPPAELKDDPVIGKVVAEGEAEEEEGAHDVALSPGA